MKQRCITATALIASLFTFFEAASQCDGLPCPYPTPAYDAASACVLD
ncbi:MAG: hypothetical protein IT258_15680, partial [Saprospiraceae bacterium]|nr:hypothetical protein [Saprospiraceae bacterium]